MAPTAKHLRPKFKTQSQKKNLKSRNHKGNIKVKILCVCAVEYCLARTKESKFWWIQQQMNLVK
jgi:hypothetical protein